MHIATVSSTLCVLQDSSESGAIYNLSAEFSFPEQYCSISWARR